MSNKSPIFPMPEPHHFSDYGFDPQIDYLQVLEEARKQKQETSTFVVEAPHFKLQKPISDEESKKKKKNKKRWWRNALLFWKWKRTLEDRSSEDNEAGFNTRIRACRGVVSGPVYITESRSGSTTPCRSRPTSGPLAGTLTPTLKGDVEIPYLCLRELNLEQQQPHRISTSAMPIYLVT